MDKISRRKMLKGLGLAFAGTALGACAKSKGAPDGNWSAQNPQQKNKQPTISWWNAFATKTCKQVFPMIVKSFEQTYPKIKVDFEINGGPPGGGNLDEVLLKHIAAGDPPDTVTLWNPPVPYAVRGLLMDIDGYMAKAKLAKPASFYEAPFKSCQWRGKTYALPASAANSAMFISTHIFEAKGVSTQPEAMPKTWDELKALSAQFTAWEGDMPKQIGFVPWAFDWTFPLWSALNGGRVFDDKTEEYVLESPENIKLLEYWVAWLDEQFKGDIDKLNIAGNWGGAYPGSGFAMEKAAICEDGAWAIADAPIKLPFTLAKYPVGPNGKSTFTAWWPNWFAMPKGCPSPDQAFLFLEYICTKGWVTWYQEGLMDPSPWKSFPANIVNKQIVQMLGDAKAKEVSTFFRGYLENGCPMWNSPVDSFATRTISNSVYQALRKEKKPAEALKEAQERCQAKLKEVLSGA